MEILKEEFEALGYMMSYTLCHGLVYHFDSLEDLYIQQFEIDISANKVYFYTLNKDDEFVVDFNLLLLINKQMDLLVNKFNSKGDEHYG